MELHPILEMRVYPPMLLRDSNRAGVREGDELAGRWEAAHVANLRQEQVRASPSYARDCLLEREFVPLELIRLVVSSSVSCREARWIGQAVRRPAVLEH